METGSSEVQPASGWSNAQIATVALLGAGACLSLLAGVFRVLGYVVASRGRSRETAPKVDSAVAELGLQKSRADLLEKRNTPRGPEAYSAAAPEVDPDPFVVGTDDESDSNVSDKNIKSPRGRWAARPRRAVPATQVQPNEIRPITLLPKVRSRDGSLGTAIVVQNLDLPLDGSVGRDTDGEELPKNRRN